MLPFKTILHPTDFSDRSQNAFTLARTLAAGNPGAKLIVTHVAYPPAPPPAEPYIDAGAAAASVEEEMQKAKQELDSLKQHHPELAIECVATTGTPAEEIGRIAREMNCDAIVMGTHGRSGLSRLLLGSVAEQVIRDAPCPVITIKEPVDDR